MIELSCILTMVVDIKLFTTKQTHTSKTGNLNKTDFIDINIPVVIQYYSFVRCYHWGKLGNKK